MAFVFVVLLEEKTNLCLLLYCGHAFR